MDRTEAYIQKGVIDVKNKQDIDDVVCGICGNGVSTDSYTSEKITMAISQVV